MRFWGALGQSQVAIIGVILGHAFAGKESQVKDTELYAALLKLPAPWVVGEVRLDVAAERVDVWIEAAAEAWWSCPECDRAAAVPPCGMARSASGGTWTPASAAPICTRACRGWSVGSMAFLRCQPVGRVPGRSLA